MQGALIYRRERTRLEIWQAAEQVLALRKEAEEITPEQLARDQLRADVHFDFAFPDEDCAKC